LLPTSPLRALNPDAARSGAPPSGNASETSARDRSSTPPASVPSPESPNLDLLRATAVLCVFYGHLAGILGLYAPKNLGLFGVVLFFVHTSYVLMGSLQRLEAAAFPRRWPLTLSFAIRRIFRIYPLSIVCVILVPLLQVPRFPGEPYVWLGWPAYLSNLAITQNLTHSKVVLAPLWTLPIEVQMYAVLPFLYMELKPGRYRSFLFWIISVVASLAIPLLFQGRLNILLFGPCFIAGIVAYDLSHTLRPSLPSWLWPITLALVITLWKFFGGSEFLEEVHHAWLFALVLGVLVTQFRDITSAPFVRAAHEVAKYSYGIYLSHVAIFWFAIVWMSRYPVPLRILAGTALSVLVPVILYHAVEKPFIRLGASAARPFQTAQPIPQ
jgi:peptidoglycan/LPS O-acetylase OafA/YrhL